jgi:hypothetical protein
VPLGLQGDEQRHGLDQGEVRECLGEVPEVLARGDVDFLGVQAQRPGGAVTF